MLLLVQAPRDGRAPFGGQRHRLRIVLLIGRFVFDAQRVDIEASRALAELDHPLSTRCRFMRECTPGVSVPVAPQVDRGLLDVEFQFEETVTPIALASLREICPRSIDFVQRETPTSPPRGERALGPAKPIFARRA